MDNLIFETKATIKSAQPRVRISEEAEQQLNIISEITGLSLTEIASAYIDFGFNNTKIIYKNAVRKDACGFSIALGNKE